jgi:ADP-ribose pyrophosphatase
MEVGVERIELPDGRTVDEFLWIETRDFAMAVAITPDGQVVLERSYKHGPRRVALALPAGHVNEGETPDQAVRRELLEETGYTSDDWRPLGSFTVDGNYGVCTAHLFLARNARMTAGAGGQGHDDLGSCVGCRRPRLRSPLSGDARRSSRVMRSRSPETTFIASRN